MPQTHPKEFRDDVVATARRSAAPIAHTAQDIGISDSHLRNLAQAADVEHDERPAMTSPQSTELHVSIIVGPDTASQKLLNDLLHLERDFSSLTVTHATTRTDAQTLLATDRKSVV